MAIFYHCRVATWLTAMLVALWPAAVAQACCCTAGPKLTEAGVCPSPCCAAESKAESCCRPIASATSHDRDVCGCGQACGAGEVRAKLTGTLDKSASSLFAALAGDGWLVATWPAVGDLELGPDRPEIPARPKRILYGVWRN